MSLTLSELRSLRGAPLSVLLALRASESSRSVTWLCTITGYTAKTIEAALAMLVSLGYVNRYDRYAWEAANVISTDQQIERIGKISRSETENFPIPSSSSSRSINQVKELTTTTSDREKFPVNQVNYAALQSHGVREPALSRLSALPHVNPVMIHDHFNKACSTGQAIHRIENDWPIPPSVDTQDYSRYIKGPYAEFINHE
ncbi:MAG: hypothetical protein GYA15_12880 [Leptolinea sp.]|jgi:hypothetical protein|nr:hypothetical protein [Leptolinea sp.]